MLMKYAAKNVIKIKELNFNYFLRELYLTFCVPHFIKETTAFKHQLQCINSLSINI